MAKTEMNLLQAEMLYSAFKANCLSDLKTNAVLCGKLATVGVYIGDRLLVDFPVSDLLGAEAFTSMITDLETLYKKKFDYYRAEIARLKESQNTTNSGGT